MKIKLFLVLFFSTSFVFGTDIDSLHSLIPDAEPAEQSDIYNQIGKSFYRKGSYANALEYFSLALEIAQTNQDSLRIAKMHSNIGVIKDVIGNYSGAIESYQQSLSIYEKLNNKEGRESVLNNIGIVYEEMENPDKALEYYFQALNLKKERGDLKSMGSTYNNIAIIFRFFKDDSDSAYYYYNQALRVYEEINADEEKAPIYCNLGLILLGEGKVKQSQDLFKKALITFQQTQDPKSIANALYYLGLADYADSKYNEALKYFLQSLELAQESNLRKLQSQLYNDLSRLYEKTGDYKKALEYNNKYQELKEDLLNLEKVKQIHQLEINFEVEKREQEIALLKKQTELGELELYWSRTITYSLIVIFVLTVIIIVLIYHRNRIKKEQELLVLQTRLFRSQTSPHFIFNSLMSIQTFLLANKVEKASEYLIDFAKLIRSILQHTRESFITLDKEIEVLQQYVKLEKLRFSDKFDFEFTIDVDDAEEILIPPMLAQPFIENAIIHGLVPSKEKGFLRIAIEEKNEKLIIQIEDNGVGRHSKSNQKQSADHKSMATDITNQRVVLIAKRFNKNISMETIDLFHKDNKPAGTKVLFTIDID